MNKVIKRTGLAAIGLCLAAIFGTAAKETWHLHELRNADPAGRPMTAGEIAMMRPIFGDSVDYAHTRLHMSPSSAENARTDGNHIYLEAAELQHADLSAPGVSLHAQRLLAHEFGHKWRDEHTSTGAKLLTIITELPATVFNSLAGGHAGYEYNIGSETPFLGLGREAQAEMIGDYFKARTLALRADCINAKADDAACTEVIDAVGKYEQKLKDALPLPGALTFKPG